MFVSMEPDRDLSCTSHLFALALGWIPKLYMGIIIMGLLAAHNINTKATKAILHSSPPSEHLYVMLIVMGSNLRVWVGPAACFVDILYSMLSLGGFLCVCVRGRGGGRQYPAGQLAKVIRCGYHHLYVYNYHVSNKGFENLFVPETWAPIRRFTNAPHGDRTRLPSHVRRWISISNCV